MPALVHPSSRIQSERTIAIARAVLAITAVFAVWLDPPEPNPYSALTFTLYWLYVMYSSALALWTIGWQGRDEWFPAVTHAGDIIAFSIFQYLTLGPSSPFFVYFIFSMFCGAVRWGWRGTLATGALVLVFYIGMAVSMDRATSPGQEVNRFAIRMAYLAVATGMLVYLGLYEARLRTEIERLARWPTPLAGSPEAEIGRILEYGGGLMQAGCVVAVWETSDEPELHEARWTPEGTSLRSHPPGTFSMLTDDTLARSTFISGNQIQRARSVLVSAHGRLVRRKGVPLDERLLSQLAGNGLATAPIQTETVSGRVFFSDLGTPPAETVPLTEVVAREIASSLDQLHSAQQRQEIAAREERIRVARDLHDGVLQGLTGVRLELRALSTRAPSGPGDSLKDQLASLERALAMEQRELRFFISGLEPGSDHRLERRSSLTARLDSLRERLALEWKTPVTLRMSPLSQPLREPVEEAIPLMVHEATVNALKHAHPTRVSVDIETADGHLRIAVTDDGHGFPFKGNYDHEALSASRGAPQSLLDRVTALGGRLSIESSDQGSRVEMRLSL